jgi:hypothetical protein
MDVAPESIITRISKTRLVAFAEKQRFFRNRRGLNRGSGESHKSLALFLRWTSFPGVTTSKPRFR